MPEPNLTEDERRLASALDAMEKARAYAQGAGNLIKVAEIDDWFREHAPVIRALRDKQEGDW